MDPQDPAVCAHDSRPRFSQHGGRILSQPGGTRNALRANHAAVPPPRRHSVLTGGDSGRAGIRTRRSRRSGPGSAGGGERPRLLWPRGCPVGEHDALRLPSCSSGGPRLRKAGIRKLATELDTGSFCSKEVLFQEGRRWAFCPRSGQRRQHLSALENEKSTPRSPSLGPHLLLSKMPSPGKP